MDHRLAKTLAARRAREQGAGLDAATEAPFRVTLAYPSPYSVAMSSLGYLQIYRLTTQRAGVACARAVLPDREELPLYRATKTELRTIERQRRAAEAHVFAISHAYELELAGLATLFELSRIPPLREERGPEHPLVVIGGPITFSNPMPTSAFADLMLIGEAEDSWPALLDYLQAEPEAARGSAEAREALFDALEGQPGVFIPSRQLAPPPVDKAQSELPARAELWSPDTELSEMMLIEPERGCHRLCTFCVMRRTTNDGMRTFPAARVLPLIPEGVKKVGLVGAAVTDHPEFKDILRELVDGRGLRVGVSSLRADRLDDELVGLLARGGYRSITVALDAPSARTRKLIEKRLREKHLIRAAELARAHKLAHLKVYVIVGLPGETEEDRAELCRFSLELSKIVPVVLGVSPFVPKFHTPLADAPFAGVKAVDAALKQLKRGLRGKVKLRTSGAREAYVEYRLAQGGPEHGKIAIEVAAQGGKLSAWQRALKPLPERYRPPGFEPLVQIIPGRRAAG